MSEVKWIKLSTHMFEDEKIRLIESMPESDTILIVWVKLLSLAGRTNTSGYIFLNENIPYSDEMLATLFNRKLNVVRMALDVLKKFGMIEIDTSDRIFITNWDKYQNIEGLEKIREQNRLRKQKERDKKRLPEPSRDSHVTVTPNHATDIDLELDLDLDTEPIKEQSKKDKVQQAEQFDYWWNLYANKIGRAKCLPKYQKLAKKYSHETIVNGTQKYHEYRIALKKAGKHVPDMKHPSTFLNGEHFNDEYDELIAGLSSQKISDSNKPFSFRDLDEEGVQ